VSGRGSHGGGRSKPRGGHDEEPEEHENHERWLVSYADMMTLLMVLFIVMFAISQVDSKKFMALKMGLESGFGAPLSMLDGADSLLDPGGHVAPDSINLAGRAGNANADPNESQANDGTESKLNPEQIAELVNATNKAAVKQEVANLKQARKKLEAALAKAGATKAVTFHFDERGLVATIATDKVLFESGSATLLPRGRRILDALAPALGALPNLLRVDGHTDSNPIFTGMFPSNWELSTARATGVLRYLAATRKVPYSRMYATGFADTRPLKKGHDAASFTANRRVEIVVLARVDDSAGRAVEELGNTTTVTPPTAPAGGVSTERNLLGLQPPTPGAISPPDGSAG
jgi:chemotaxis protein MotB